MENRIDRLPSLCIAIPTYNEELTIKSMLESIINNSYPINKMKIYVADALSTDRTVEIARSVAKEKRVCLELVINENKLPAYGLNRIAHISKEDIFVRCDAHSLYETGYLITLVQFLLEKKSEKIITIGGCWRIKPLITGNTVATVIARVVKSRWGVGSIYYRQFRDLDYPIQVDTAPFSIFWLKDFLKIGGYDESMSYAEDDELNFRVLQNGGEVWLHPKAKSVYYPRSDLSSLARQYFRYGMGKSLVFLKHKRIASWRQLPPLMHVLASIICILGAYYNPILFCYFIPYAIFLIIATLYLNRGHTLLEHAITPVVISVLHYSYGFGYLSGLLLNRLTRNEQ